MFLHGKSVEEWTDNFNATATDKVIKRSVWSTTSKQEQP